MKEHTSWALWIFNTTYLFWGGAYFLLNLNFEFVFHVAVIIAIIGGVLLTAHITEFPVWQLWLFSIWGLMHVLGGAVTIDNGVLFGYHIYPFLDLGGEFYILKYDQVLHFYLYGVVAVMALHLLRKVSTGKRFWLLASMAVLISLGVSALNEIMEFIIAITMERNGVGGYEDAMLDLVFNLPGAVLAVVFYSLISKEQKNLK